MNHNAKYHGVVIPISALKSNNSLGCGDFNDLSLFGHWAAEAGFKLIQLLPINDTGDDSSPYMALSSVALHPIYLHLNHITFAAGLTAQLEKLLKKFKGANRVDYAAVLKAKLGFLSEVYEANQEAIMAEPAINKWLATNGWVITYAVFKQLKDANKGKGWPEWKSYRQVTPAKIDDYYHKNKVECFYYVWLQYELQLQLNAACKTIKELGLYLKGDIPIMMNEDSADVWSNPQLFDLTQVAGAPPDQFSYFGQRWGFPCYNWAAHRKEDFKWWKLRLTEAAKFFDAYRIDHVLGFFRIWAINKDDYRAALGHFDPFPALTKAEITERFGEERLNWLSAPHIFEDELNNLGPEKELALPLFKKINDNLYFFDMDKIKGDKAIFELAVSEQAKEILYGFYSNRALLLKDGNYYPTWYYQNSRSYQSLNDGERQNFDNLIAGKMAAAEHLWEAEAQELLGIMAGTTDMLVCAEDLGALSLVVPKVLTNLKILSLAVMRWKRNWQTSPPAWDNPGHYPFKAVATLAVHDSSPIRLWWREESDKTGLLKALQLPEALAAQPELSPLLAGSLLTGFFKICSAQIVMLQLQDYFAVSDNYREADSELERINIPGTVGKDNWSYRMKPQLEELINDKQFSLWLKSLNEWR